MATQTTIHENASRFFAPRTSQVTASRAHAGLCRHIAIVEEEAVIEILAIAHLFESGHIFGSRHITGTVAHDITLIKIASAAGIDKIDTAFNFAIVVKISSALLGTMRILITQYLAILQDMTVAFLAKRDSLSLRAGILHRDIFHVKIGRIDGKGSACAAIGLDLLVLARIINHFSKIIVPSDDHAIHIFAYQTDHFTT